MRKKDNDVLRPRTRELIRRWADRLPAGGFTGTVAELSESIRKRARWGEWVGPNCTRAVVEALAGTGFTVSRVRTWKQRLVRVARVKRARQKW